MKKLLLIIPLIIFLTSCEQRNINAKQLQHRNGIYYVVNEEKPFSGKATGSYANGQLKFEVTYVKGQMEGLTQEWYENGQLELKIPYINGEIEGVVQSWYEEGQLKVEMTYVKGKLEGLLRKWYENGQLKSEETFVNGKPID